MMRDVTGQSYPIYHVHVLVLITRVIHRSTLRFEVAGSIVYYSDTWEKTWQVESVEDKEQYHMKFVEKSHHLKRSGRKRS